MSVRREASPPCLKQENCCLSEASVPLRVPNEGFSTNIASTNGNRRGGAFRLSDVRLPQNWSRYGWVLFKDPQHPDRPCGLNWSVQHLREVYSRESESPKFFADVDLDAARSRPVGIACSRKGRFSSASIDAASGWYLRSFLAARGCADHRSRLSHSWPP